MARAVPEILYFRCPVCSKRFPGSAFEDNELQVECVACGAIVDSPHVTAAPNDRAVESPFSLAGISHEATPPVAAVSKTEDITQQLRQAFDALSQIDQTKFLEETMPKVDLPKDQEPLIVGNKLRLMAIGALLMVGFGLLALLYLQV